MKVNERLLGLCAVMGVISIPILYLLSTMLMWVGILGFLGLSGGLVYKYLPKIRVASPEVMLKIFEITHSDEARTTHKILEKLRDSEGIVWTTKASDEDKLSLEAYKTRLEFLAKQFPVELLATNVELEQMANDLFFVKCDSSVYLESLALERKQRRLKYLQ